MHDFLSVEGIVRMSLELSLGVSIKLFCDNGRIHWRDFVSDFLFWVPGVVQQPGDGLSRQIEAMTATLPVIAEDELHMPMAAK